MPVMDVAAAFYTSGTFWAGAGALAAFVGAVAVVWVTFVVGLPRRRLYYGIRSAAPLLTAPPGMRSDLELRHRAAPLAGAADGDPGPGGWQVLADPRVLTIDLVSRGRRDIPSDAYDGGQPLRLDVGARIVRVLRTASSPAAEAAPPVAAGGTSLEIGPGLIRRRQEITLTVLTDGGEPALTCRSPLIDVQVRPRTQDRGPAPALLWVAVAVAAAVVAGAFGAAAAATASAVAAAVVAVVAVVAGVPVIWASLRDRR
jgi:hypothetical protein